MEGQVSSPPDKQNKNCQSQKAFKGSNSTKLNVTFCSDEKKF